MQVELRGVTKRFPGVTANNNVDLSLFGGEVHTLLGENGAGKSTLMNVLFGLYQADEGQILIDDQPVDFNSPADAIDAGIGMVHQHFMLVPVFSVIDNVMLGNETTGRAGLLDRDATRARLAQLSRDFGLEVDPDAIVEDLPVGVQQRVEILKALYRDVNLLILDEPTAVLTPPEVKDLFRMIRSLTDAGRAVVFISHKLKEVLAISDRITVLRAGEVVGTAIPAEADEGRLASMMVGREVQLEVSKTPSVPGEVVLDVRDLAVLDDRGQPAVDGATLDVKAGEIVAIAGVQGNGQTELVEAITGMRPVSAGTIHLEGEEVTGASPKEMFGRGVAHVPEDRQEHGLVATFPVKDNLVLNSYKKAPYARGMRVDRRAIRARAEKLVKDFDVRTPSIDAPAGTLSGGNQQKVIAAREFTQADTLLIAAQPTRGLDVGSIQYIHAEIVAKRDEGKAVLIVSSELDEIFALGDRIAVMYQGKVVAILDARKATRDQVGLLMSGVT